MRRDGIGSTLLSIVLAATMAVGLCPTPAMANPSDGHDQEALQPQDEHTHDGKVFQEWTSTESLPTTPGNYYLSDDVTLNETWQVPAGEDGVRLCLGGHTIEIGSGAHIACGDVDSVDACVLALYDDSEVGTITSDGSEGHTAPFVTVGKGCTLTMVNGQINGATQKGAVAVYPGGAFGFYGGTIEGNRGDEFGGVFVARGAVFDMSGGVIDINGGSPAGGVYVQGGTSDAAPGIMRVSGSPLIINNYETEHGSFSNVFLGKGVNAEGKHDPELDAKILITDELSEEFAAGVSMEKPGVFTSGWSTSMAEGPGDYFSSDDNTFTVKLADTELMLYKAVESVALDDDLSIEAGKTAKITSTITPSDATNQDLEWSSNDESVATVDEDGVVTAYKAGTAVVTAKSIDNPEASDTCDVTVWSTPVSAVKLDKKDAGLKTGDTLALEATVEPGDASIKSVTWKSSDESVATVDEDGVVTAQGAGTATITATSVDNPDAKATCEVTVTAKPEPAEAQDMFRLYNPYSGEHFYTASAYERDALVGLGWHGEGVGWSAPAEGAPVYRLYNPYAGDHHYTVSAFERDHLVELGWTDEGVGWHSAGENGVPVYRQYNPYARTGAHNYTTSEHEAMAIVELGWLYEGIGWYGL